MTAKIITTTYAGYFLAAAYNSLTITSTGAIDGVAGAAGVGGYTALTVDHAASVQNAGSVVGGAGGTSGHGGDGANFSGTATLTNTGVVIGGHGGSAPGGVGGDGGAGVVLGYGGEVVNGGTIAGGAGGTGKLGNGAVGDGVLVSTSGSVNNTGVITGLYAVYGAFGTMAVSVTNSGSISGSGVGVELISTGANYVDNAVGGHIYGKLGAVLLNSLGTVANYGTMTATISTAVELSAGGGLTNGSAGNSSAKISGLGGVEAFGSATITNFGTIDGGVIDGIDLLDGGRVVNKSSAKIVGAGYGIAADLVAATVVNYGTLQGSLGAVEFNFTSTSNRLILEGGSKLIGGAFGGGGTLELASGAGAISGLGNSIGSGLHDFPNVEVDSGGTWTLSGANYIATGDTLTNAGRIILTQKIGFAGLNFSDGQTLSGGGTVSLSATGYIGGAGGLTNLDNTIVGGGIIKSVTLTNDGTIDNNLGRMVINTGNTVTNHGLIECMATGQLLIRNTTVSNTGGGSVIDAHRVQLDNATLLGGSLTINKGETLITILHASTINLPGGTVTNAGFIDGAAGGGLTIMADVANSGFVQAYKGNLTIKGTVTGAGQARVLGAGVLEVDGALDGNLVFAAGSTGKAVLGGAFTGFVFGLSHTGANSIDLKGVTANGYSYKGTASSGTLTLLEGATKVTTVKLSGNYLTSTFVLTSDGGTGTIIKDPTASAPLAQAMAAFGGGGCAGAPPAANVSWPGLSRPPVNTVTHRAQ